MRDYLPVTLIQVDQEGSIDDHENASLVRRLAITRPQNVCGLAINPMEAALVHGIVRCLSRRFLIAAFGTSQ
jgi:hypothetical protein